MLADLNSRHICRSRRKLATDVRRRIRLEVPRILVRRPTPHKKQDARLGTAERALIALLGVSSPAEQFRQRQPKQAERAQAECFPPSKPSQPFELTTSRCCHVRQSKRGTRSRASSRVEKKRS